MLNLFNRPVLVFDIETEGLNLFYSKPWDLSWIIYENYKEIESVQHLLKWKDGLNVSAGAVKVTNFNPFKVEQEGKDAEIIITSFCQKLLDKKYLIVFHNGLNFDCMILRNAAKRFGIDISYEWLSRCVDTNAIFKSYKLKSSPKDGNFLAFQFKMNNYKQKGLKSNIGYCCQEFGVEHDTSQQHQGNYDCKLTYKIFIELMKKIDYNIIIE